MNYENSLKATSLRIIILLILFSLPILINAQQTMRINLHVISASGEATLMDGNLTNYDPVYSNDVDMHDAWKMNNFGENLGIYRHGHTLVAERRKPVIDRDTTFLKMWNVQQRDYQLQVITKQFDQPWLTAVLKDNYLLVQTKIELNDTTVIPFSVTADPGSYNNMRFEIQYSKDAGSSVPPFMDLKTWRNASAVQIEWNILNEVSVDKYVIEHSADGRIFNTIETLPATNNGYKSYSTVHLTAVNGENFYRIKAYRQTGSVEYSTISKVSGITAPVGVYPNPVVNRKFKLKAYGKENGIYNLALIGPKGVVYPLKPVKVTNGLSEQVDFPVNIVPGIYRLKINIPGNPEQIITVYLL